MKPRHADETREAHSLEWLGGSDPVAAETIAVVVAHPDDETLGCGAQLARLRGVTLVHITDGAPRNTRDGRAHDFKTLYAYEAARQWGA